MMIGAAWLADSWLFLAGCTGRGRVAPDQRQAIQKPRPMAGALKSRRLLTLSRP
jgi:hypothetical protein